MKKLILAILAVGAVATAQAQKAGSLLLYGTLGYQSTKVTSNLGTPGSTDVTTKNRAWQVAPGIGYQVNNFMTVGLNFGIAVGKNIQEATGTTAEFRTRDLLVGPFVRFTTPVSKSFFVYNQLNVAYLNGKTVNDDGLAGTPDDEDRYNGFGALWFPAAGINVNDMTALNFSMGGLGYAQRNWDLEGTPSRKESGFVFTWGTQFNLGVSVNIGGRHNKKGHNMEPGMDNRHMDSSDDDDDLPKRTNEQ
jgi:hypothetical protein